MLKRILMIGASGFIGKHLLERLYSAGHNITTIDRSENPYDGILKGVSFNYGDIFDVDLNKLVIDQDIVIVLAGKSGALDSFSNYQSDLRNNSLLLLRVLDSLKDLNKKPTVIFPSSRLVYSNNNQNKVTEEGELFPLSPYGIHKLSCEYYLKAYKNMYNINYIIFRISIPYGSDNSSKKVYGIVNSIIEKAKNDKDIVIFGSGEQLRDIIYIEDLVEIIARAIDNTENVKNDTYNLGGSEILSLVEIANSVIDIFGKGKIVFKKWPKEYLAIETGDLYLDSTKIYAAVNYTPQYKLVEICRKILKSGGEH